MRTLHKILISTLVVVGVLALANGIITTNTEIELKRLDIRVLQTEIDDLNKQIDELKESDKSDSKRIQELKEDNERLQQELVSKRAKQAEDAKNAVYAASVPTEEVVNADVATIKERIVYWSNYHGVSVAKMDRIAGCESGWGRDLVNENYYAGGGNPGGVYQFLPETWNRIGSRSPYGVGNRMNYEHNIRLATWAFANGYGGEWECQ